MDTPDVFENALEWYRQHYLRRRFFAERDVVWTFQQRLASEFGSSGASCRVFNDHTVMPRLNTALAILNGETIEVAIEFMCEPSHRRRADRGGDKWPSKIDVVDLAEVRRNVQRIRELVGSKRTKTGYAAFIDEAGHFRRREPIADARWIDWDGAVHWFKMEKGEGRVVRSEHQRRRSR